MRCKSREMIARENVHGADEHATKSRKIIVGDPQNTQEITEISCTLHIRFIIHRLRLSIGVITKN